MTTNSGKLSLSVLLSIVLSAAAAGSAASQSDITIETVEVTATRESLRKAIGTFVSNTTRRDGEHVARWHHPVCPSVSGATPEQREFIRSRILEIAASVRAPVGRACVADSTSRFGLAERNHAQRRWNEHRRPSACRLAADYIAMVSLARIDLDADFGATGSILRLFGENRQGSPKRLTNWDHAFLKALYRPAKPLLHPRTDIMSTMREELAP